MKNNIDVFYFSTLYPLHVLFVEDGKMGEWAPGIHSVGLQLGSLGGPVLVIRINRTALPYDGIFS